MTTNDNYKNKNHFLFNEANKLLGEAKPKYDLQRFFCFLLLPVLVFCLVALSIVVASSKNGKIIVIPENKTNFLMQEAYAL